MRSYLSIVAFITSKYHRILESISLEVTTLPVKLHVVQPYQSTKVITFQHQIYINGVPHYYPLPPLNGVELMASYKLNRIDRNKQIPECLLIIANTVRYYLHSILRYYNISTYCIAHMTSRSCWPSLAPHHIHLRWIDSICLLYSTKRITLC